MYRVDGFYSGPIAQDWFASVGGFYRNSNGVRNSQYPADNGGQLTATLTHKLDSGTPSCFLPGISMTRTCSSRIFR